jgi:hypothetical protein
MPTNLKPGDVVQVSDGNSSDYAIVRGTNGDRVSLYCDRFTCSKLDTTMVVGKVSPSEMRGCSRGFRTIAERLALGADIEETVGRG